MGIAVYAPAIALEALTGISNVTAILVIGKYLHYLSSTGHLD